MRTHRSVHKAVIGEWSGLPVSSFESAHDADDVDGEDHLHEEHETAGGDEAPDAEPRLAGPARLLRRRNNCFLASSCWRVSLVFTSTSVVGHCRETYLVPRISWHVLSCAKILGNANKSHAAAILVVALNGHKQNREFYHLFHKNAIPV